LQTRLEDPQQHTGLIKQFIDLLRESVQTLLENEKQKVVISSASGKGFWQKLFSTGAENDHVDAQAQTKGDSSPPEASMPRPAENPQSFSDQSEAQGIQGASYESALLIAEPDERPRADNNAEHAIVEEQVQNHAGELDQTHDSNQDLNLQPQDDEPEAIQGELIRDRSGLAEPAFSYIAGHVEPLLLRILESIHITAESVSLAESIRRSIIKGLNWYDFVAILEQILLVLRNAADGQRAEFQGFLSEVTESLAQVQAFVDHSKHYSDKNAAADAEMDATVRAQIQGIKTAVEQSDTDIESLKSVVQHQIGSIISSLDGFKAQRSEQDQTLSAEMRALTERIASLENESSELRLNLARQQENATKDTLTELPNREAYNRRLRQLLDTWLQGASYERRDDDRSLCLAVADVDLFKNINDSYGHLAGDKVLKIIAREMVSRLREKDFIGRYGGEEFVIVMPDTRPADAEHALNKLRLAVAAIPFHFKERQIQITISFGVVEAERGDTPETLFDRADKALYKAKENGRNRVHRDR
jgi:diguanylate cyclase